MGSKWDRGDYADDQGHSAYSEGWALGPVFRASTLVPAIHCGIGTTGGTCYSTGVRPNWAHWYVTYARAAGIDAFRVESVECEDTPPSLPGDLNGDCEVNGADLGLLVAAWGSGSGPADLDGNGTVEGGDLGIMLAYFGTSCP